MMTHRSPDLHRETVATDAPVIDLRRRPGARLQVSRIAAELFWRDGVAGTRGEDIASEAGISTRTLWRYFGSKETCIEPVLVEWGVRFLAVLEAWPPHESIDEFLHAAAVPGPVTYSADDIAAMRMIVLGDAEPALRSAWLMVCDAAERQSAPLFAARMGLPSNAREVLQVTASVSGAIRAFNDELSRQYVEDGTVPDGDDVLRELSAIFLRASNGRLGPAVVAG